MGWNLRRHGSRDFDIFEQFCLAEEALRIDFLLLRKHSGAAGEGGRTLSFLWPRLPTYTVFEYKSPSRPLRAGDLDKLWAYIHLYASDSKNEAIRRDDICGVLAVPHRTPTLNNAVKNAKLRWENLGGGYFRVLGGQFVLYVVELDVAGLGEPDGILYGLGTGNRGTDAYLHFYAELIGSKEIAMQNLEGYQDIRRKVLSMLSPEERLEGLAPQERLAGLAPQERLAGLDHDQQALALPLDVLKLLPKEYFQSLSPEVQAILEERLAKHE